MDSGRHKLSENIWFVWSKMSFSGDKEGCHACPRTDGCTEHEDKARNLEPEFTISTDTLCDKYELCSGPFLPFPVSGVNGNVNVDSPLI